jgi:hypothetical protein
MIATTVCFFMPERSRKYRYNVLTVQHVNGQYNVSH